MPSENNITSTTHKNHLRWYNETKINALSTKEERIKHLQYLCMKGLLEIILIPENKDDIKQEKLKKLKILMDEYNRLNNSINTITDNTKNSCTIQTLKFDNIIDASNNNNTSDTNSNTEYKKNSVLDLYLANTSKADMDDLFIKIKDKTAGVEPGCIGTQFKDVLIGKFNLFFTDKELNNLENWKALLQEAEKEFTEKSIQDIYEQYDYYLLKNLYTHIQKMVTVDCVVPNQADLKRSGTMEKINRQSQTAGNIAASMYQVGKTTLRINKNKEALDEWLGNEFASSFMRAQSLELVLGECHKNLIFLLKGKWENGTSPLKIHDGVLVNKSFSTEGTPQYTSDASISQLGEIFLALLLLLDRDGIGLVGQNKLRVGNDFLCIDTGKAFSFKGKITDILTHDFHVTDKNFKNYSIKKINLNDFIF